MEDGESGFLVVNRYAVCRVCISKVFDRVIQELILLHCKEAPILSV